MKGAVFALFCAIALVHAEINENGCPINPAIDVLLPHLNCNKYYQCSQGDLLERNCGTNLVFNVETQECDWPENVDCENRVPAIPDSSEEDNKPGNNGGNDDPNKAPEICAAEGSEGVLVAHENCNQFYECNNGAPVAHRCASNLLFNPSLGKCDWPENVNCGDRNPDGGNGGGGNGEGGNGDSNSSESSDRESSESGGSDGSESDNNGGANSDPSEAQKICAAEGSDGVLVAHENCNQFYKCSEGKPVALNCGGNLLYNPANEQCDWPENVNCDRNSDVGAGGSDNEDSNNGGSDNEGTDNNGGNSDPSQAQKICAAEGSDGVLVAHENCNQFYKCSEGKPVALNCGGNLLYNPAKEQCDWPDNVNCDRNSDVGAGDSDNGGSDNGGSDNNGGNSDPSQAQKICAAEGSDGVLVAHENCNQFYKCSEGKPVALNCGGNLLYNPANEQCDWPENVNCDRNSDVGAGDSNNGNSDNGGSDNEGSDNNGGNSDPSEAQKICAAEGSDGVLVAHENCNQFYKCSEGKPVALDCGGNLLYNPANEQCDWPENVNCDRNSDVGAGDSDNEDSNNGGSDNEGSDNNGGNSDPSQAQKICAAEGSDGVLVAHENCNQFYKCSEGKPVALDCGGNLLYNPANEQCDWPENVNCDRNSDVGAGGSDNGDSDNNGGNSDPSQAKKICAAEDSEGVLVAHEYCSLFYICNGGEPVIMNCSGELVFNPSNNQCDYPENVDCGNRNRSFTSFNKHLRRFSTA